MLYRISCFSLLLLACSNVHAMEEEEKDGFVVVTVKKATETSHLTAIVVAARHVQERTGRHGHGVANYGTASSGSSSAGSRVDGDDEFSEAVLVFDDSDDEDAEEQLVSSSESISHVAAVVTDAHLVQGHTGRDELAVEVYGVTSISSASAGSRPEDNNALSAQDQAAFVFGDSDDDGDDDAAQQEPPRGENGIQAAALIKEEEKQSQPKTTKSKKRCKGCTIS